MTNNEKLDMILAYIGNEILSAGNYANEKEFCSAEWIYHKAKTDTLLHVCKGVERIINKK